MSKCTNNTGFSFSLSNGTSLGWDSNGTPCSINANKPTTTSIDSYYPNVSGGYHATARPYIAGLDGRFESSQLVVQTNPYISSSSSFPTFTPPTLPPPPPFPEQPPVLTKPHPSDSPQEKALAVNVFQKMNPYLTQLKPGEWHLGVHTASFEGRKSKDTTYGLSNQIITCLQHLKTHGGADTLKVLTFMQCDLTPNDMIYFGNTILIYPLSLNYLDFSGNRIGDIGTISFINSFVTSPTVKYPMHHIINLNLSNNSIGDDGAAHIAAYLKHGYMPATTHVNLADNNITDTGAAHLADSLKSKGNKLNIIHLEGNRLTSTGEGYLVKALLDKATQHMVIFTQRLEQNSKLFPFVGTKEEKTAMYKEYLKKGIEKGTNDQAIVVDKSLWGEIVNTKNQGLAVKSGVVGFIKCNWKVEGVIESYAQDKLTAKISKTLTKIWSKITNIEGVVSCYLEATDEMYTSEAGQKALTHEVHVAGESDVCSE